MIATILDTRTGERHQISDVHSYQFYEGNWSCDCNRYDDNKDYPEPDDDLCESVRFLVVAFISQEIDEGQIFSLEQLNDGYPEDILLKHGIIK